MYELREKLLSESKEMAAPPDLQQFLAAVELFYPGSRRGAAGPLDYMSAGRTRTKTARGGRARRGIGRGEVGLHP